VEIQIDVSMAAFFFFALVSLCYGDTDVFSPLLGINQMVLIFRLGIFTEDVKEEEALG